MKVSSTGTPGLVSIIVASYNHAEYLEQRIASLFNQTYKDIEILVIDDKSTDDSLTVLRKYEGKENYTLISRESNGGWVEVSNQGAELAKGEYILFGNCDDFCEPDLIEKLVMGLQKFTAANLAFSRSKLVDANGAFLGTDFSHRERAFRKRCTSDVFIPGVDMKKFLLHSCVIPNLSAALIRRDSFLVMGGFSKDYLVCCDWDLFFKLANTGGFFYVSEPLNDFRQHGSTIRSTVKNKIIVAEYFRLLYPNIDSCHLQVFDKIKYSVRVGKIWADNLLLPSLSGIQNFRYHLSLSLRYNKLSGLYLIFGMLAKAFEIISGMPRYAFKKIINRKSV